MYEIIIVGGGPAGVSAALTANHRSKRVLVISNAAQESDIYLSKHIANYPGLPNVSGSEMMDIMRAQLDNAGIEVKTARALNAMPMGDKFFVSLGADNYECRAIILATGVSQGKTFPGEHEFIGKGVSYCATCDGMLYRGKKVAVIGLNSYAAEETAALRNIGCEVEYFDMSRAKNYEIRGGEIADTLVADGAEYPVAGIFILRDTVSPSYFLPGLETKDRHIAVNARCETSVKGVYAAGDCTGRPYQIANAVGQGNVAAVHACEFLDKK